MMISVRPFTLGCAALLLIGCRESASDGTGAADSTAVAALTAVAKVQPFTHTVGAIGTVVARPSGYASLSAPSPGRIARVLVTNGQRVGVGTVLVELDQTGFAAATGAAAAGLTAAQRNYERALRLANEGILPRKDAEAAAAELGRARAEAAMATRAQKLSVLRSPISGVVTRLDAVLGASADAGQVLVDIADPRSFDIQLSLGATDAGQVHEGAAVTLSAGEKRGGESVGTGRVASVGVAVDSVSRAVAVRVVLVTSSRALRLGEGVYGEIATGVRASAVVVPAAALVPGEEPGSYTVFVVDARGIAHLRAVSVGERTAESVEITEGLKGGETVVTQGAFGMQDSSRVTRAVPVKP